MDLDIKTLDYKYAPIILNYFLTFIITLFVLGHPKTYNGVSITNTKYIVPLSWMDDQVKLQQKMEHLILISQASCVAIFDRTTPCLTCRVK